MKKHLLLIVVTFFYSILSAQIGRELYRPTYHYTPGFNWMSDPNGLVFYNGKYHLFYQYNPFGNTWGNMSWGHAVSSDLINWEQKPVAIPMKDDIMIFSGSVVVDWNNTSGFGINNKPPFIAIYTGSGTVQDQRIAFSNDEGLTWTNYSGNPVISSNNKQFRDPKVIWHEETQNWIMVVGLGYNNRIGFYKSRDLKNWNYLQSFGMLENIGEFWECPDLFKLNIDDDSTNSRWVLVHSLASFHFSQYFVGDFDGEKFTWTSTPPNGLLIDDFETGNYQGWTISGNAFGGSPASGKIEPQSIISGFLGNKLVNSFNNGDAGQGKMISGEFTIQKNYINFLISGGNRLSSLYISLVVDGQTIRKSTGDNDLFLTWKYWDVSKYIGQTARIEIVDSSTSYWGSICIDHILQSDVIVDKVNAGKLDYGMDCYATQSFSDIPQTDGRRIWMSWMNNWNYANAIPTSPWKGIMTIPREVKLETHNGQIKLVQKPIKELDNLHKNEFDYSNKPLSYINEKLNLSNNGIIQNSSSFKQFELKVKIPVSTQKGFSLKFKKRGLLFSEFVFDFENKIITFDRSNSGAMTTDGNFRRIQTAPLIVENGYFDFQLFVDNCSAELFASSGQIVMSNQIFPDSTRNMVELTSLDDDFIFDEFKIWRLDIKAAANNPSFVNEPLFNVYPNPVINANGLTIKIKDEKIGEVKFKLLDAAGKLIYQFQPTTNSLIVPRNIFGSQTGPFFLFGTDGISNETKIILVTGQ